MSTTPYRKLSADLIRGILTKTNYLYFGDAEEHLVGWSEFTTTFTSGVPTTITAGAANLNLNRVTSNPLKHEASYEIDITTAAASTGQGVISDIFTISDEDLAKVLEFGFTYFVTTSPANLDFSGTSTQTLELWVYNVGLTAWTQPTGFRGMNNKYTQDRVASQFQTDVSNASNKNQYRVAIIIRNDPTGTAKINFDSVSVSPQLLQMGTPVTDFETTDLTPNASGFGTVTNETYKKRRVGDSEEIFGYFKNGTVGAATAYIDLPSGQSLDTSKIDVDHKYVVGSWWAVEGAAGSSTWDNNANEFFGPVFVKTSNPTRLYLGYSTASGLLEERNVNAILNTNDSVTFECRVPISGWSSNVQMSQDTDTRSVDMYVKNNGSISGTIGDLSYSGATDINFGASPTIDTHGGYSSGVYTVAISGRYKITAEIGISAIYTAGNIALFGIFINGTFHVQGAERAQSTITTSLYGTVDAILNLKAGDTVSIRGGTNGTSPTIDTGADTSWFSVEKSYGTNLIAVGEEVSAIYKTSAGQSLANNSIDIIDFGTKEFDSHGAVTTGASWKFTAPISGRYRFSPVITWSGNTSGFRELLLYKNNVQFVNFEEGGSYPDATVVKSQSFSRTLYLIAGDFVDARGRQGSGGNLALTATDVQNFISIEKVK